MEVVIMAYYDFSCTVRRAKAASVRINTGIYNNLDTS